MSVYGDKRHPLRVTASVEGGLSLKPLTDAAHKATKERIKADMKSQGISVKDLGKILPNAKSGKLGVSESGTRRVIAHPEEMTRRQVEALCNALGCTFDYLRGEVAGRDSGAAYIPTPEELQTLFDGLTDWRKAQAWALLCDMETAQEAERGQR